MVQYDTQNVDVDSETQRLYFICEKYGTQYISCPLDIKLNVIQMISIVPQDSTFLFIFSKKKMIVLFLAKYQ